MSAETRPDLRSNWTWLSLLFLALLLADLAAIAWYFASLPDVSWQGWKKVIGTIGAWIAAILAFFGIKHQVAKNITIPQLLASRPSELALILLSIGVWLFCVPFHVLQMNVRDADGPVQGASVSIDGANASFGQTDPSGNIRLQGLAAAQHTILVDKPGYEPRKVTARFSDVLCVNCRNTVELSRARGNLEVTSDPPGAVIYLDNDTKQSHGTTPNTFILPTGLHCIVVKLGGYADSGWEQVEVEPNRTTQRVIHLKRIPEKTYPVLVYSDPPGAAVFEGTRQLGTTNGKVFLPAGQHLINVDLNGRRLNSSVTVPAHEAVVFKFE